MANKKITRRTLCNLWCQDRKSNRNW